MMARGEPERQARIERFLKVDDLSNRFPALDARFRTEGIGRGMQLARERVLREHSTEIILNHCPKCGTLCLTPVAKACLDCGHTWHEKKGASE